MSEPTQPNSFHTRPTQPLNEEATRYDQPLIIGEYEVLERLGAGGMGEVFKARHLRMDRIVAMKMLPQKLLNSPAAVERFHREVKASAKLVHPNIVAAYDAGVHEGSHYLVMEYVEGRDLSYLVENHGPMPVEQALGYILQAAQGLSHAHKKGVIHRDVKPANMILDSDGIIKILDMGLAVFPATPTSNDMTATQANNSRPTQTGMVMGTASYMAPEQAQDMKRADHRADIYSLGCSLFYLLTGRDPFVGDNFISMVLAHQNDPIPKLLAHVPQAPTALENVFQRMLAKEVDFRYQAMQDVVDELEAILRPAAAPQTDRSSHPCTSAAELVQAAIGIGAITQADLDRALSFVPSLPPDADGLAKLLVQSQLINGYQAGVLLRSGPGDLVYGEYLAQDMLADDGLGLLLLAKHQRTGRQVVVKVFGRGSLAMSQVEQAAQLKHPHIARILDYGHTAETDFVVTEYLPEGNLGRRMRRRGTLLTTEAVQYALQVSHALAHAHKRQILHGHIGPTNLLLDDTDSLRISDFGWAGLHPLPDPAQSSDQPTTELTLLNLTAPEMLGHFDQPPLPTVQSDMYSLGVTLFYLLTGVAPPKPKSRSSSSEHLSVLKDYVRNQPQNLQQVLSRLLAPKPAARFQSVDEVVVALEAVLDPNLSQQKITLPPPPGEDSADLAPLSSSTVELPPVKVSLLQRPALLALLVGGGLASVALIGLAIKHFVFDPVPLGDWLRAGSAGLIAGGVTLGWKWIVEICTQIPLLTSIIMGTFWAVLYYLIGYPEGEWLAEGIYYVSYLTMNINLLAPMFAIALLGAISGVVAGLTGVKGATFMSSGAYLPVLATAIFFSGFSNLGGKKFEEFQEDPGVEMIKRQQWEKAIAHYQQRIQKDPEEPSNHYHLGRAYAGKGSIDQAIASFSVTIEKAPGHPQAHTKRGDVYSRKQEYKKAIEDYDKALALKKEFPQREKELTNSEIYGKRGEVYAQQQQFTQALDDYDDALAEAPNDTHKIGLLLQRAKANESLGRTDAALRDREQAQELFLKAQGNPAAVTP